MPTGHTSDRTPPAEVLSDHRDPAIEVVESELGNIVAPVVGGSIEHAREGALSRRKVDIDRQSNPIARRHQERLALVGAKRRGQHPIIENRLRALFTDTRRLSDLFAGQIRRLLRVRVLRHAAGRTRRAASDVGVAR